MVDTNVTDRRGMLIRLDPEKRRHLKSAVGKHDIGVQHLLAAFIDKFLDFDRNDGHGVGRKLIESIVNRAQVIAQEARIR